MAKPSVKIVTDSTAHLPADLAAQYDIRIVPLHVILGEKSYREGIDITNAEFYARLRANHIFPTTAQPSVGEFQQVYTELVNAGYDVISIHLSSKLSGAVSSAQTAADQYARGSIQVVDSQSVSLALGMLALEAARAAAGGANRTKVMARVQELIPQMNVLFAVDTLEFLRRGGRIGGATALLGTLLTIKPILHIADGRIEPLDRVRTKGAAHRRLLEEIKHRVPPGAELHVGVLHVEAEAEARELASEIAAQWPCCEMLIGEIAPVIGTHVGPGTFGVTFHAETPA